MSLRQLPNLITVARLLLALPIALLVLRGEHAPALILFLLAGLSDGLDGFLAKRFGWQTRLGGMLDPLADKLLVTLVLLTLALTHLLPLWLLLAVLLRDLVIVSGATAYRVLIGPYEAAPTLVSKLNTGFLLLLILATLGAQLVPVPQWLLPLLALISLVTVVTSGSDYVLRWSRRARDERRRRRASYQR